MQISLVQWVYLIFVVYLIFLIRCLGIVINTSSIFGVQDVLGWPRTLSGAICCLCLLIISLFFFLLVWLLFYYCYLYLLLFLLFVFLFFVVAIFIFLHFVSMAMLIYGLIFCFPTCFFVYFSFGCSTGVVGKGNGGM